MDVSMSSISLMSLASSSSSASSRMTSGVQDSEIDLELADELLTLLLLLGNILEFLKAKAVCQLGSPLLFF